MNNHGADELQDAVGLRDAFAMMAMHGLAQALAVDWATEDDPGDKGEDFEDLAVDAYAIADAMMHARTDRGARRHE